MTFDRSRRTKLTRRDLGRFPSDSLLDRIGRVLCEAECLPRKELFESWEVARRVRRRFRGGRVVDLACGHGLIAHLMLVLDDTSERALACDLRLPPSASAVTAAMITAWPRIEGRVHVERRAIEDVELLSSDVVVSAHACGGLTDEILRAAVNARARVAVLPCCHALGRSDLGGLEGWLDGPTAIDATRAASLRAQGYSVYTQRIAPGITAEDRLLLAEPA
jgi:hypothetical protein